MSIQIMEYDFFKEAHVYINYNEVTHVPLHSHAFIEIAYIADGCGIHTVDDRCIECSKGDYFIINYDTPHGFHSLHPMIIYNCIFRPEFIDISLLGCHDYNQMLHHYLFSSLFVSNSVYTSQQVYHADAKIDLLFKHMFEEYEEKQNGYLPILKAYVTELLFFSLRQKTQSNTNMLYCNNPTLDQIMFYICEHYNTKIYLKTLANIAYVSPEHLSREFKKYTGYTVTDFIKYIRIDKSKSLLLHTKMTIYEISEQVGYMDCKHYSKVFFKLVGVTPARYRKKEEV